ncbi:pterin binding enzyme family protein [Mycobacterium ulcerans str. Harvey]|uniref:Methionine synthase n=1 Tax=Mycobacterium ulcerans str. Harvey TaxID=1299332 RepID=A0ABP3A606_MYCUL|nr:pterin binding enzyme family protein [Mycobacterium ulcerans str. Harvey]
MTEAFWNAIRHAKPIAVGLNCALGAPEMRPYIAEMARIADTFVSCYPNAGLPNAFGEYDETPSIRPATSPSLPTPAWSTWSVGAAGRRAAHRRDREGRGGQGTPRAAGDPGGHPALGPGATEHHRRLPVREHRRAHQHHRIPRFRNLIKAEDYDTALSVALQQVEVGAQVIDINMDEGMIDGVAAMDRFTKLIAAEPDISGSR